MNGIAKFSLSDKDYTLRFNLAGVTELERRLFSAEGAAENTAVFTTNLIYGGLYGEAFREDMPTPKFSAAVDLLEEIDSVGEAGKSILSDIWDAYQESRFGQDFKNFVMKAAKDLELKKSNPDEVKKS